MMLKEDVLVVHSNRAARKLQGHGRCVSLMHRYYKCWCLLGGLCMPGPLPLGQVSVLHTIIDQH